MKSIRCTEDAIAFGKEATKKEIRVLQEDRKALLIESGRLRAIGEFNPAFKIAQKASLYREAFISHRKKQGEFPDYEFLT